MVTMLAKPHTLPGAERQQTTDHQQACQQRERRAETPDHMSLIACIGIMLAFI